MSWKLITPITETEEGLDAIPQSVEAGLEKLLTIGHPRLGYLRASHGWYASVELNTSSAIKGNFSTMQYDGLTPLGAVQKAIEIARAEGLLK